MDENRLTASVATHLPAFAATALLGWVIKRAPSAHTANEIASALAEKGNAPLAREAFAIGLTHPVPDAASPILTLYAVAKASLNAWQTHEIFDLITDTISAYEKQPDLQNYICQMGFEMAVESLKLGQVSTPALEFAKTEIFHKDSLRSRIGTTRALTFAPMLADKDAPAASRLISAAMGIASSQESPDLLMRTANSALLAARHAADSNQMEHVQSLLEKGLRAAFDVRWRTQDALCLRNALEAIAELAPQLPVTDDTADLLTDKDLVKISRLEPTFFPQALTIHMGLTESLGPYRSDAAALRMFHACETAAAHQMKTPEIRMPTGESCVTATLASGLRLVSPQPRPQQGWLTDLIGNLNPQDPDHATHLNMIGDTTATLALWQAQGNPSSLATVRVTAVIHDCCDGQGLAPDEGLLCAAFALSAATTEQKQRGLVIFTAPEGPVAVNGDFCGPLSRVEESLTMLGSRHPALPNLQWFHNIRDRWTQMATEPLPTFAEAIQARRARLQGSSAHRP